LKLKDFGVSPFLYVFFSQLENLSSLVTLDGATAAVLVLLPAEAVLDSIGV